ncbi:hypothetical protein TSUD_405820 [Trifolium subterraneum]|uniref:Retrotransposon Copia-like N-terminal domain-containing protein n=1 Tax=Trifolium subterraneum TaxID=3900 RepID=A0A2Z6NWE4_TRISU|nr:hypothetical protein TSUD_405820 [Trifolium subterraneum]
MLGKPSYSRPVHPRRHTGVRIVVAGDKGTGKSSLIRTAASNKFRNKIDSVLPPQRLPIYLFPDIVPIRIIDTSSSVEDSDKVDDELHQANVVLLTYACDRPETLQNLTTFWLPRLRQLKIQSLPLFTVMPPRVAPPPPADPSSDPSSPYYVHSSDGPGSVKVTPPLNGSNYHSWARSMRRALGAKLKFEFVDGSIPAPVDAFDPSYRAWNRCNMLIHSWIMNSVDSSIAQSIVFMENVSDVWLDLKDRFSQGDLVRVSELQQEIYALTQDSRSVTSFYSDLKSLWEELEIYMPIPVCTCHIRCSCDAMRVARNNHHILHAMRFLTDLNDNFNVV